MKAEYTFLITQIIKKEVVVEASSAPEAFKMIRQQADDIAETFDDIDTTFKKTKTLVLPD